MKLRIRDDSLRFRLTRSEVENAFSLSLVRHGKLAPCQKNLKLESEQNVKIVRDFVSVGSNQTRGYLVDREVELFK